MHEFASLAISFPP